MADHSLNQLPVPPVDVVSWAFGDHASYDQDKPLLLDASDPSRSLSARKACTLVRQLVSGFMAFGLQKGDVVGMICHNDIMFPIIVLGIIGAGGVYASANPQYTSEELAHMFSLAKPRFVIADKELLTKVASACNDHDVSEIFTYHPTERMNEPGSRDFHELLEKGSKDWVSFNDKTRAQQTPAGLFCTSGTTGLPKLAVRTHLNFVNESVVLKNSHDKPYVVKRLVALPIFHAFAAPLVLLGPFREGHTTYIQRRFEIGRFLELLVDAEITETVVAPPLVTKWFLGDGIAAEKKCMLKSLKTVTCAGAPLSAIKQYEASKLVASDGRIVQCYGMTEGGWMTTFQYPEEDYSGSVGRPLPNTEVKVVDESGNDVTLAGTSGELLVRSPSIMLEYLDNTKATQEIIDESGWMRTGDCGFVKDGKVFIVDRIKELIKVNAFQVAPAEIEDVLASHSEVKESAAFGVSNADGEDEMVHIMVIRAPGSEIDAKGIKTFLLQHLAKQKVQHAVIHFGNNIPRNPSGKILRRILREEVKAQQRLAEEVASRLKLELEVTAGTASKIDYELDTRYDSGNYTSPQ